MSGTFTRAAGFVLAALACNGNAIAAERSASSRVDINFSYELIDLNLNDGITPALDIRQEFAAIAGTYRKPDSTIEVNDSRAYGTISMSSPFGSATASLSPTSAASSATIGGQSPYGQLLEGATWGGLDFTLTPGTGLLLKGVATISGHTSDASTQRWASVGMNGYLRDDNGVGVGDFNKSFSVSNKDTSYYILGYLHTNDVAGRGDFRLFSSAGASLLGPGTTPPVPEPESWAMMLAGLAITGALARRRRRQR